MLYVQSQVIASAAAREPVSVRGCVSNEDIVGETCPYESFKLLPRLRLSRPFKERRD